MSATTTLAPSRAKTWADARPIPMAAPVTTATFPSRDPIAVTVMRVHAGTTIDTMGRFEGKVALVSGAASGIGLAIAARLADEGATVVGGDLTEVAGGVVCDVRDADACAAAVAFVLDRHGRLDVLANVAG